MLKAKIKGGPIILGIDEGNVERLKKGHPILVNLAELGGTGEMLLFYGETLEAIRDTLQNVFDCKLPEIPTITNSDSNIH
jgi:hypothetical protein